MYKLKKISLLLNIVWNTKKFIKTINSRVLNYVYFYFIKYIVHTIYYITYYILHTTYYIVYNLFLFFISKKKFFYYNVNFWIFPRQKPCLPQKAVHMAKYGFTDIVIEFKKGSGVSHNSVKI